MDAPTIQVPLLLWRSQRARSLSERERAVVGLAACGFDNQEIASRQGVELSTVRAQLYSSMRKLGCRNRTQLVMVAVLAGLVDFEQVLEIWRCVTPEIVAEVEQVAVGG